MAQKKMPDEAGKIQVTQLKSASKKRKMLLLVKEAGNNGEECNVEDEMAPDSVIADLNALLKPMRELFQYTQSLES